LSCFEYIDRRTGHSPLKTAFHAWESGSHLLHGSSGPPESICKRYLDRFSRFRRADGRDKQTDRPTYRETDHATPSITIGRIYIYEYLSIEYLIEKHVTDVHATEIKAVTKASTAVRSNNRYNRRPWHTLIMVALCNRADHNIFIL